MPPFGNTIKYYIKLYSIFKNHQLTHDECIRNLTIEFDLPISLPL